MQISGVTTIVAGSGTSPKACVLQFFSLAWHCKMVAIASGVRFVPLRENTRC